MANGPLVLPSVTRPRVIAVLWLGVILAVVAVATVCRAVLA